MGVDASASSLAPNPVVVEQKKPVSVVEHQQKPSVAVTEIFDRSDYESPQETLAKLAAIDPNESAATNTSIETNIDNSSKTPEASVVTDSQPETPHIDTAALEQEDQQKTAEEIKQVNETIQQESTPKVEAVIETPKTLFPDSPPLYDKYHQAYEREKKTIKGALARSRDIRQLQKDWLKEKSEHGKIYSEEKKRIKKTVVNFYDSLRSRGIPSAQILEKDSNKEFKILPTEFYITGIQRLDSLGLLSESFLNSDEKLDQRIKNLQEVAKLYDHDFKDVKDQLNQYSFLSGQDIIPFVINNGYKTELYQALSSIQKEFFSTPDNQQKFADYLSQHPELGNNLFGFTRNKNRYYKHQSFNEISPFISTLIDSGVNSGQRINIPQECIKAFDDYSYNDEKTWYLGLETRDQQRFFLEKSKTESRDKLKRYFNYEGKPMFNYFKDNLVFTTGIDSRVTLPDGSIIDSTDNLNVQDFQKFILASSFSPEDKPFYHGVASLKGLSENSFIALLNNRDIIERYFQSDTPLTSEFFREIIHNPNFRDKDFYFYSFLRENLTSDILQNFRQEDQIFWQNILKVSEKEDIILEKMFSNESFITKEGLPTNVFFKDLFYSHDIYYNHGSYPIRSVLISLTSDYIKNFPLEDQKFWSKVFEMTQINRLNDYSDHGMFELLASDKSYFDSKGELTSSFFKNYCLLYRGYSQLSHITDNLTPDVLKNFTPEDQKFWQDILKLEGINILEIKAVLQEGNDTNTIFNSEGKPQSCFFEALAKNGFYNSNCFSSNFTPELITTFSSEDQELWNTIANFPNNQNKDLIALLLSDKDKYIDNGIITPSFYQESFKQDPEASINSFTQKEWRLAFGNDVIDDLLNSLPKSTDEKRNAFTHNQYDRTSQFFDELLVVDKEHDFQLNAENIKIATEYIKNFGLAKSPIIYKYFSTLYQYEQGSLDTLPNDFIQNKIETIQDLKDQINEVRNMCFSSKSISNPENFSDLQTGLLSIVTGHARNRWTRIPIENIFSDFSRDMANGQIAPLDSHFHLETIPAPLIKLETSQDISDNKNLSLLKGEIISAITDSSNISSQKDTLLQMFNQRIDSLTGNIDSDNSNKNVYLQRQIDAISQISDLVSKSDSIDNLLTNLVAFNFNFGTNQEQYNSILRQLVFKKVFTKHQNSPDWQENIRISLENNNTVSAVDNMLNLVNNTIKDHALNFEHQNQDGYWENSTFETMKKYSSVLKKNLSFPAFTKELQSFKESFVASQVDSDQTIQLTPDRGLIGEMSGYMADVCYTKVYPLLKQYPELTPYKFVSNPDSDATEFIGSTLVFKVNDADNQPVFLIRAFDIPKEDTLNIGSFFESFVDHLTPIAKSMGIKKILAAGTAGTISNYSTTTNYVLSKYVHGKEAVPLADRFSFNGYNITNECFLVRDTS